MLLEHPAGPGSHHHTPCLFSFCLSICDAEPGVAAAHHLERCRCDDVAQARSRPNDLHEPAEKPSSVAEGREAGLPL